MMNSIYLDNAATTKMDPSVVEEMQLYFSERYGNASSLHSFGKEARKAVEESRKVISGLIGADPSEVIFTSGATESNALVLLSVLFGSKKHIVTTTIEHSSVRETCKFLEKQGVKVTYAGVDKEGMVLLDKLEEAITSETGLVSIGHANSEIGTIQDIEKIGEICERKGVTLHVDAAQSFAKVSLDMLNVGMASFSAHKIHGPKGVGALYVKQELMGKLCSILKGGGQEFGKRGGTENVPGIAGFAKAAMLMKEEDVKRMERLRDNLIKELENRIDGVKLNGSRTNRVCTNVNMSFPMEGESLVLKLDKKGICVSAGSACASGKPSHVLHAIGVKGNSVRISLSKYTTEEEIQETVNAIHEEFK